MTPTAIAAAVDANAISFSIVAEDTVTGFIQSCIVRAVLRAPNVDWVEFAADGPGSGFFAAYTCTYSGAITLVATGASTNAIRYTVVATAIAM